MIATVERTRKTKLFTPTGMSQIVNRMDDDAQLLALAKERRNNSDRELVNVDELISYLRK